MMIIIDVFNIIGFVDSGLFVLFFLNELFHCYRCLSVIYVHCYYHFQFVDVIIYDIKSILYDLFFVLIFYSLCVRYDLLFTVIF